MREIDWPMAVAILVFIVGMMVQITQFLNFKEPDPSETKYLANYWSDLITH